MTEKDLLVVFYEEKISKKKREHSIDDKEFLEKIESKFGFIPTDLLKRLVEVCAANKWLRRKCIGQPYRKLAITEEGSELANLEMNEQNKNIWKNLSDKITSYNGIFIIISIVIAILSLIY